MDDVHDGQGTTTLTVDDATLQVSQAARRWIETDDVDAVLHDLLRTACRVAPCRSAAIGVTTQLLGTRPLRVRAASDPDEFAVLADVVRSTSQSPGILAAQRLTTVACPDLAGEARPELTGFARATVERTDLRAVIAVGLHLRRRLVGVLSLYFAEPLTDVRGALDRTAVLADHAGVVLGSRDLETRRVNLEAALQNARTIGAAVGILVERHRLTEDAAFELLRTASQDTNRKLSEVAEALVATGELPG